MSLFDYTVTSFEFFFCLRLSSVNDSVVIGLVPFCIETIFMWNLVQPSVFGSFELWHHLEWVVNCESGLKLDGIICNIWQNQFWDLSFHMRCCSNLIYYCNVDQWWFLVFRSSSVKLNRHWEFLVWPALDPNREIKEMTLSVSSHLGQQA